MLRDFHDQGATSTTSTIEERMRPLDVVKVLMGIYSDRPNIKRFMNESKVWAKFQDYDYEDIYKVAHATVSSYYLDRVCANDKGEEIISEHPSKTRKLND